MNRTQIEWVRNPDGSQGYSWNPITGCLNGCEYCYARKLARTRLRSVYTNESGILPPGHDEDIENQLDPFYPRFWPDRLLQPSGHDRPKRPCLTSGRLMKGKGIFTCDMSDMFGPWVPGGWISAVMKTIRDDYYHRFYLLTKFPENLVKWSPFPKNCWVGTTATDAQSLWIGAHHLMQIDATVKYVSIEPLLRRAIPDSWELNGQRLRSLDWVIIGARTQPLRLPQKAWVDEIIEAADMAGIPVFLKNSLAPLYPSGLRQEVPQ